MPGARREIFARLQQVILVVLVSHTFGRKSSARSAGGEQSTERNMQVAVAGFLIRQHFSLSISERIKEGKPMVAANLAYVVCLSQSPWRWDGIAT